MTKGHYARIDYSHKIPRLCKAVDENKDQTYFLAAVPGKQLANVIFPIGHLQKVHTYLK